MDNFLTNFLTTVLDQGQVSRRHSLTFYTHSIQASAAEASSHITNPRRYLCASRNSIHASDTPETSSVVIDRRVCHERNLVLLDDFPSSCRARGNYQVPFLI
jgi:hypothetical protein